MTKAKTPKMKDLTIKVGTLVHVFETGDSRVGYAANQLDDFRSVVSELLEASYKAIHPKWDPRMLGPEYALAAEDHDCGNSLLFREVAEILDPQIFVQYFDHLDWIGVPLCDALEFVTCEGLLDTKTLAKVIKPVAHALSALVDRQVETVMTGVRTKVQESQARVAESDRRQADTFIRKLTKMGYTVTPPAQETKPSAVRKPGKKDKKAVE